MKICWRCKVELTPDNSYPKQARCKACNRELVREWRHKNPKRTSELKAADVLRLRERVLTAFQRKCNICGFNNPRALQVDHIHGGGLAEKRLIGTVGIYRRALRQPDEYQLLCANCNILKLYALKEHLCRSK